MRIKEIEARVIRLEKRTPGFLPGPDRYTDEELDALIDWLRQPDPTTQSWAATLLRREGMIE
ncbi:cytochrome c [Methylobacterium sp. J-030]|uniref:cytochrome c n=1 Tax=Methylobacterium sp. J-030 TaxID=2836627 RepID=UPI001FBB6351|nr:cytochrome c [Methylobacterium sp. J-030]MCJ2067558.1 cytochrome c [Methylobacterium sp. J-030]